MYFSKKIYISSSLIKLLITSLLFYGFVTNFLSFSHINTGSVIIDLLVFALILHITIKFTAGYYTGLKLGRLYFNILVFWIILLTLTFLKLLLIDTTPLTERLLGMRNNILYMMPLLYIPLLFKRETEVENVISIYLKLSLLLVFFSICQFIFSTRLPESLLVLRGESVFSFYGTTIARPTALLGNTIIFASFTIILFSIYLAKYLYEGNKRYLFILLFISIGNVATLTRASIVGLFLVSLVSLFLRYARFTVSFIIKFVSALILLISMAAAGAYVYKDTFIVRRLTGKEASTQGSNNEHFQQIYDAIRYLKKHYIVGSGIGSQGASGDAARKIITDGYWYQLMLENGFILGLLYLAFYISCVVFSLRTFYKTSDLLLKQLCMAFVAFSSYFYAASFLNSGFAGRTNFIIYWIIFGLLVAQYLIVKKNQHAFSRN